MAGAEYPSRYNGYQVLPMEGRSLLPLFRGKQLAGREALFFERKGNAAVRAGRWKGVALRGQPWELYDMEAGRTELHDLAAERPELRDRLIRRYREWARRVGAGLP